MTRTIAVTVTMLGMAPLLIYGCDTGQDSRSTDFSQERKDLRENLQQTSNGIDRRLEEIGNELENASEEAKDDLREEQSTLEQLKDDVVSHFRTLRIDLKIAGNHSRAG